MKKIRIILSTILVFILCGVAIAGIYDRVWIAQYGNSLSTAITRIGSTNKHLIIPTAITVDLAYQDMNMPSNIDLEVSAGGSIDRTSASEGSGYKLIVHGTFYASARQVFLDANDWVTLYNTNQGRKPEWWGGDPNDYTAYGKGVLDSVTTAVKTTIGGAHSGDDITTGSCNTGWGHMSLEGLTTGGRNAAYGDYSGYCSTGTRASNVYIGSDSGRSQTGSYNVFAGDLSGYIDPNDPNSYSSTICIGYNTQPLASNQCVIGGNDPNNYYGEINEVYIGQGVLSTAPSGVTVQTKGVSGSDVAGGDLTIAAGKSTGNATGGDIIFQTSDPNDSGAVIQELSMKMQIISSGKVGINISAPDTYFDVNAPAIRVGISYTPAGSYEHGATGKICWDASYIYIWTAPNTVERAAIATW